MKLLANNSNYSDPSKNNLLNLDLPEALLRCYEISGLTRLFDWQLECLNVENVLKNGRNLIYNAPTSAGKSLVAEILILNHVLKCRRKALYILPYVSVAREKMVNLQSTFRIADVRVDGFIGTTNPTGGLTSWDVAICTIEKANSLVNRLIESREISEIGIVVVDELHTVGDCQRGYLLELLMTKLMFCNSQFGFLLQLIGMSATLPNLHSIAKWLNAALYSTDFRPVPLVEYVFCEKKFYNQKRDIVRILSAEVTVPTDTDNIVALVLETVLQKHGVLVFCSTKVWCEQLANTISKSFDNILKRPGLLQEKFVDAIDPLLTKQYVAEFKRLFCFMDPVLGKTLPLSVAFHHAGLTMEEREQIERGFRLGYIRVLIATSTLSSGVNLPAKRVIIRSPWGTSADNKGPFLTPTLYKQMAGRAGRQGIDTTGESIIMCKPSELKRGRELIESPLQSVHSTLICIQDKNNKTVLTKGLKRAVLEVVVSGLAKTMEDTINYMKCTFFYSELSSENNADDALAKIRNTLECCVQFLLQNEFIEQSDENDQFRPTQLGLAALTSALPPDEALAIFADLQNAQRNFVLDSDLHLLYLVTPYACGDSAWIDWTLYYEKFASFSKSFKRVAEIVGVSESFLSSASHSGTGKMEKTTKESELRRIAIHKRFFAALILYDLINEKPVYQVAQMYGCNRGFLQSLQQQSATYAGMLVQFCDRLGWYHLKVLLSGFAERIAFGVRRELTELVQIDGIDGGRARTFHSCGLSTIANLVQCELDEIVNVLRKAVPFQSGKQYLKKHSWLAGHPDLTETEAAQLVLERAKKIFGEKLHQFGISARSVDKNLLSQKPANPTLDGVVSTKATLSRAVPSDLSTPVETVYDPHAVTVKANLSTEPSVAVNSFRTDDSSKSVVLQNLANVLTTSDFFKTTETVRNAISVKANLSIESSVSVDRRRHATLEILRNGLKPDLSETTEIPYRNSKINAIPVKVDLSTEPSVGVNTFPVMLKSLENIDNNDNNDHNILTDSLFSFSPIPTIVKSEQVLISEQISAPTSTPNLKTFENVTVNNDEYDDIFLAANLSRISISSPGEQKLLDNLPVSLSDEDILKLLNSQGNVSDNGNFENRVKSDQSSTPVLFDDEELVPAECRVLDDRNRVVPEDRNADLSKDNFLFSQDMFTPATVLHCAIKRGHDSSQSTPILHIKKRSRSKLLNLNCNSDDLLLVNLNTGTDVFDSFLNKLKDANHVAVCCKEIENSFNQKTISFQFSLSERSIFWLEFNEKKLSENLDRLRLIFLCKSTATFVLYEVKQFLRYCRSKNIDLFSSPDDYGRLFCLRTACWLINQDFAKLDLLSLSKTLIRDRQLSSTTSLATGDVITCYALYGKIQNTLRSTDNKCLENAFYNIESKIISPVLNMETVGVRFDIEKCDCLIAKLKSIMSEIENRCYKFAKKRFSLTSHREVARILYVDLGLPPMELDANVVGDRRKPKKCYSTKRENLHKLADYHAVPYLITIWRRLNHAITCYVLPFRKRAKRDVLDGSWKIYGYYDHFTATGRLIMSEPSLQTFPKRFVIENVDNLTEEVVNLRSLIVPSCGHVFLAADFTQLELRILAHFSKDEKLLSILNSTDGDVFKLVASVWKNVSTDHVTSDQRQHAKQVYNTVISLMIPEICYGIIYGMGVKTLSVELSVSENDAQFFMDSFNGQYKGIQKWIACTIGECRKTGYASTLTGRRRYLNFIRYGTSGEKSQAERQAVNTTIQGSAADIFKTAFIRVNEKFQQFSTTCDTHDNPKIVMQMHDELIVEIRDNMVKEIQSIMKHEMENCFDLLVKLPVKFKAGPTWGDLTDIN